MLFKMLKLSPGRILSSVFPIVQWSKDYNLETGICDLVAGVTVALTLVPQSIAYASLAGFEPQYGLYASFAGSFIYAFLGTCPQINIGPTALLSLLTFTYTNGTNADFPILLCFIGGFVQLLAGMSQLGFLIDFVSMPVVSGFTSAAAITIASSQIKGLLGLSFKAESFMSTWKAVYIHINEIRLADTMLSIGCCVLLFAMKSLKDIKVKGTANEKTARRAHIMQRSLWFAGVGRNAAVVILAAVVAFITFTHEESPFVLTGKITAGLPTPQIPAFQSTVGNITYTASEMLGHLGSGLLVVPLVGVIANVAIAKAFSNGKTIDATQEIMALGLCNVIGAFFRSFPVNGSFTRSAVSDASGVRTPAAGFYTGLLVILTLVLLTPYFFFIPRAALASVIVSAVLHMVDIDIVKKLWRTNRLDLLPLFGTFLSCLALGIELGLLCGVAIDVLLLLYYNSRPPLQLTIITESGTPHYAARPSGGLHFAGADRARAQLSNLKATVPTFQSGAASHQYSGTTTIDTGLSLHNNAVEEGRMQSSIPLPLVIYSEALDRIDYTSLQSMKSLVLDFQKAHRLVVFFGLQPQVLEQLKYLLGDDLLACSSDQELEQMLNDSSTSPNILQDVRLDTYGTTRHVTTDTQL